MTTLELSPVQRLNLNVFAAMRSNIKQDSAVACGLFGLRPEQATTLGAMTLHQIVAIVVHVGNECLFPPRKDFACLLDPPLGTTAQIEDGVTKTLELAPIQLLNFNVLATMRDGIKQDAAGACCVFGLRLEHATVLESMTIHQLLAIVIRVGEECLFPPRKDFLRLIETPLPITGHIVAAHPTQDAASIASLFFSTPNVAQS